MQRIDPALRVSRRNDARIAHHQDARDVAQRLGQFAKFINATGGVIISYASNPYTVTNAENVWIPLHAIGVAPQGTVTGRTLVGLVGTKAVEAVGRNPGASGKILVQSILGMALAEAVAFYALFLGK